MAKLNQIIAVANGAKSRVQKEVTEVYHKLAKPDLITGIARTYTPRDEDGERLPPEEKRVQLKVPEAIRQVSDAWTELFDIVATQDSANCVARADIVVDGQKILTDVPVTHLLFLEKRALEIAAFIDRLPTLDPAYEWEFSKEADCWAAAPVETHRTKKVPRNHVVAPATDKHPAQVQVYHEDIVAGYWKKVDFSGAIPQSEKNRLAERVQKFQDAIKVAREQANDLQVEQARIGKPIFDYLFG